MVVPAVNSGLSRPFVSLIGAASSGTRFLPPSQVRPRRAGLEFTHKTVRTQQTAGAPASDVSTWCTTELFSAVAQPDLRRRGARPRSAARRPLLTTAAGRLQYFTDAAPRSEPVSQEFAFSSACRRPTERLEGVATSAPPTRSLRAAQAPAAATPALLVRHQCRLLGPGQCPHANLRATVNRSASVQETASPRSASSVESRTGLHFSSGDVSRPGFLPGSAAPSVRLAPVLGEQSPAR